ncbi:MAG: hypothetical protein ACRBN8_43340 [Nannocystales bacterium]
MYAAKAEPVTVHWLPDGETTARELPAVAERSGSWRSPLDCIRPDDYLMTYDAGEGQEFFEVDLTMGDVRPRFPCPKAWAHVSRGRWSYSRDGSRLLMIDTQQRRLGEFDARTGALLRTHLESDGPIVVQSVREAEDGYWLTGMTLEGADSTPYKLMHYRPGEEPRIVRQHESSWIFGVEPSRDGSRLATDTLTLHGEVWLGEVSQLCAPR